MNNSNVGKNIYKQMRWLVQTIFNVFHSNRNENSTARTAYGKVVHLFEKNCVIQRSRTRVTKTVKVQSSPKSHLADSEIIRIKLRWSDEIRMELFLAIGHHITAVSHGHGNVTDGEGERGTLWCKGNQRGDLERSSWSPFLSPRAIYATGE